MIDLREYIERSLERDVAALTPLGGGDVADAFRVTLADGARVFAKTRRAAPAGFFVTEAAGLAWLREADAAPIPEVLSVCDDPPALILEWIEAEPPETAREAEFGRALAALHAAGAPSFGREDRRSTGSRGLPNEPCESWSEFYATNRLLPLARLAAEERALPPESIRRLEAIAQRLAELGGPTEPPARLHGDLWGGNRMVGPEGISWLIDPAAHGGHREFDLAMMRLFGGFGEACFAAYAEASPLADGWTERVPLHQLAPLVVHAIKFGGSYIAATRDALDALC
ncbi:MAG: fructosamine kinase family protein [Deltaproteobacteria bacterium]|nr:fructosamine kinase family protein [Deltaproteobacteria bacterium]MBW2362641.1 fructosamine kinase family protein [Deltaproteobacteria bacterium]